MPDEGKGEELAPVEGLAGGPGPTPPGFDDGTPHPEAPRVAGEDPPARPPPRPEDREDDATRRAAGRSGAARGDPEEPDPS
jgi:hypothetical protein